MLADLGDDTCCDARLAPPGTQDWLTSPPGTQHWFTCTTRHTDWFTCTTRHTGLVYMFAMYTGLVYMFARHTALVYMFARHTALVYISARHSTGFVCTTRHTASVYLHHQAHRIGLLVRSSQKYKPHQARFLIKHTALSIQLLPGTGCCLLASLLSLWSQFTDVVRVLGSMLSS